METAPVSNGPFTGGLLFYTRPEPLEVATHGKLGITPSAKPFKFAQNAQATPLQVTEFSFAARFYPIVFSGDERAPMAVMGIQANQNLFINDGVAEPNVYIPAFIRRYPFALANNPAAANGSHDTVSELIVCVDRNAEALVEGGEVPLFEEGHPSAFTQQVMQFCADFENDRKRSDAFVSRMNALDLFEPRQVNFTPNNENNEPGEAVLLASYFGISEEKLNALPPEVIKELHVSGALRQIYAHFESQQNWDLLVRLSQTRSAPVFNA